MTMKCPYLIKYETTQMVFQYSSAADKKNKSNIAIKIPNEFEMFLLSNCMRAPEAVSCFFVTQQFMRSCAWCSNSSILPQALFPADPARSAAACWKRQRLLANLGFKGHEDLSVLQSGWFDDKTQIFQKGKKHNPGNSSWARLAWANMKLAEERSLYGLFRQYVFRWCW